MGQIKECALIGGVMLMDVLNGKYGEAWHKKIESIHMSRDTFIESFSVA